MRAKKIFKLSIVFFCALVLSGCANKRDELVKIDALPAEDIALLAQAELKKNRHKKAANLYAEVERLYPYSDAAKRALIQQAYIYLEDKDYESSRSAARRFLDFYPADKEASYAQYLYALSYYNQIGEVGRDEGRMILALNSLNLVFERYPKGEYASAARAKYELVEDHLAAKEMEVGRYYLKRGHFVAAIERFQVVLKRYSQTDQTAEALHRLVEAYLSLGLKDEAQTAGAILGYNFQSSQFYNDSYILLTKKGWSPKATGENWLNTFYQQSIKGEWL